MARLSEKYNDSCIKIFSLLKLLIEDKAEYSEVIKIFSDETSNNNATIPVVLNKYLNTLKVFGMNVKKEKNKYYLSNFPFIVEFSSEDVKTVQLLKASVDLLPNRKSKDAFLSFIKSLEIRYSDFAKTYADSLDSSFYKSFTNYFSKNQDKIIECEKYCSDKKKLEVIYSTNLEDNTIICSPKEVKYQDGKVCLIVFNQLSMQIIEIPVDSIKSIRQLPTVTTSKEVSTSVVYLLKGPLVKSYKLREWEYSNGYDSQGNLIVVNKNEDFEILLSRLMRYAQYCEVLTPLSMRSKMSDTINKMLENYQN